MADASNTSITPDRVAVIPIYEAMLERALKLLMAGAPLAAVDMLATAIFFGPVVLRCNKFLDLFVQRTPNATRWGR